MRLTDTHCHLDMIRDDKIALLRAKEAGVTTIINVGTSIDASKQSMAIADETDLVDIYATCGIHAQEGPKDIKKYGSLDKCMDELRKMILDPFEKSQGKQVENDSKKVVAIGECGMDIHKTIDNLQLTTDKERGEQRALFERQIDLAIELGLSLIIHCRNAWDETFDLLSNVKGQLLNVNPGLFHSWTGTIEQAKRALDLGFYISFSGIVTFKNSGVIPEVAKMVPEDRILVETDSPFLSPVPLRGKQNEPKNVRITAQFIAELRGVPLDRIAEITTRNACNLFKIANN